MKQMLPNPVLDALAESQSHEDVLKAFNRHLEIKIDKAAADPHLREMMAKIKGTIGVEHLSDREFMKELSLAQLERQAKLKMDEQSRKFAEWFRSLMGSTERLRIERPASSRFHDLAQAARDSRLFTTSGDSPVGELLPDLVAHAADYQVFLVTHDWAAAFAGAEGMEEFEDVGVVLPFDRCAFEYQIAGRRIILFTLAGANPPPIAAAAVQFEGYWSDLTVPLAGFDHPLCKALWQNLQGLCIALEAEIATATMIRQPYRLNTARLKAGKLPLYDYRVLDLRHRHGQPDTPAPTEEWERNHPRLHFRRGHWRHFQTYRTWVRWCLVGDPDLGFIEKEYRA